MAALFAAGVVVFLLWRWWMVPADFGVYGHYRAGALEANRLRPIVYAGQGACLECHADVAEARQSGRHAAVTCETCHGPLGPHARGEDAATPQRPDGGTLCVQCHASIAGRPPVVPQILVEEHAGEERCVTCHSPHAPGF